MIGIEIYVPAAGKCFDVCVPEGIRILEMRRMICRAIQPFVEEYVTLGEGMILCRKDTGSPLNENHTTSMAGVQNGMQFILL